IRRLLLDPGGVFQRQLRCRVDDAFLVAATEGQDRARAVAGADEHVLRPRRAVDEVPRAELPLLTLDEQQALAREDEEVLLDLLPVVHAGGLTRREDADVDADLLEPSLALEPGPRTERVVLVPACLLRVDDEPALALWNEAGLRLLERRLLNHAQPPISVATCRRKRTPSSRSSTAIRSSAEWTSRAASSGSIARITVSASSCVWPGNSRQSQITRQSAGITFCFCEAETIVGERVSPSSGSTSSPASGWTPRATSSASSAPTSRPTSSRRKAATS